MLKNGMIKKCNATYKNPIVVVIKSSGKLRLCLNARNINQYTVPQYEAPIDAILGRITGAKVYSKIDLKYNFWLIPLAEKCKKHMGFQIEGVIYRFEVVPFGIR